MLTPAQAAPIVDQSFTSGSDLGASINDCCVFVAQTFTAGLTGTLAGVNIDVLGFDPALFPLDVAIRTVSGNVPTATVLSEVTLGSGTSLLSDFIAFPNVIDVVAGTSYAIVVNYDGAPAPGPGMAQGLWSGATGDLYPAGGLFFSFSDGVSWFGDAGNDTHFRTYVDSSRVPEPGSLVLLVAGLVGIFGLRRIRQP
jgi:hypothetical protein